MNVHPRRFTLAVLLGVALLVGGMLGYMAIEGWSVRDALYMSAITLSAVGYSEVHPLSPPGRTFTMALLLGGITWMGLWFALITSLIVELDLAHAFRRRRVARAIADLQDHVIVCGTGRTGYQVIRELESMDAPWVAIERDPERIQALGGLTDGDALAVEGDATDDGTLTAAGIARARGLVACLSADTDNLFVCLSARDLNPDLTIVARALEQATMDKLYRAGATHVVSPNVSGAIRMASMLLRPSVVSFLDIATRSSELALRMEQTRVEEGSPLANRTLAEARIPQETGLIVIALRTRDRESEDDGFVFNPVADTRLQVGDELIVLGRTEQLQRLREHVGG